MMRKHSVILGVIAVVLLTGCGGSGGGGSSCSNEIGNACPDGEYCQYAIGQCGLDGECTPIPAACDAAVTAPVCSCEGISFFSDCYAAQAGQSIQSLGDCPNV